MMNDFKSGDEVFVESNGIKRYGIVIQDCPRISVQESINPVPAPTSVLFTGENRVEFVSSDSLKLVKKNVVPDDVTGAAQRTHKLEISQLELKMLLNVSELCGENKRGMKVVMRDTVYEINRFGGMVIEW